MRTCLSVKLDGSGVSTGGIDGDVSVLEVTVGGREPAESPAGLAEHWGTAHTWEDFDAFVEFAGTVGVTVLHGSPVIHSAW